MGFAWSSGPLGRQEMAGSMRIFGLAISRYNLQSSSLASKLSLLGRLRKYLKHRWRTSSTCTGVGGRVSRACSLSIFWGFVIPLQSLLYQCKVWLTLAKCTYWKALSDSRVCQMFLYLEKHTYMYIHTYIYFLLGIVKAIFKGCLTVNLGSSL